MLRLYQRNLIVLFTILLILFPSISSAKADVGELPIEWQQFLPAISGKIVVQTSDEGYFVLGMNATVEKVEEWVPRPGHEEKHIYTNYDNIVVKTDAQGCYD